MTIVQERSKMKNKQEDDFEKYMQKQCSESSFNGINLNSLKAFISNNDKRIK